MLLLKHKTITYTNLIGSANQNSWNSMRGNAFRRHLNSQSQIRDQGPSLCSYCVSGFHDKSSFCDVVLCALSSLSIISIRGRSWLL